MYTVYNKKEIKAFEKLEVLYKTHDRLIFARALQKCKNEAEKINDHNIGSLATSLIFMIVNAAKLAGSASDRDKLEATIKVNFNYLNELAKMRNAELE